MFNLFFTKMLDNKKWFGKFLFQDRMEAKSIIDLLN